MDPISIAIGGLIFIGGNISGRAATRRKAARPPKPPVLECGCGHNYGAHEAGTRCHAQVRRVDKRDVDFFGTPTERWSWVQCPCQAYDGPEPLPRSWTPDLMRGIDGNT
jgi:hypothetical protein